MITFYLKGSRCAYCQAIGCLFLSYDRSNNNKKGSDFFLVCKTYASTCYLMKQASSPWGRKPQEPSSPPAREYQARACTSPAGIVAFTRARPERPCRRW